MNSVGKRCFFCNGEVGETCPECASTDLRSGELSFLWNEQLAKKVTVFWCVKCDATFIKTANGETLHVCWNCEKKSLRVPKNREEVRALAAAACGAGG